MGLGPNKYSSLEEQAAAEANAPVVEAPAEVKAVEEVLEEPTCDCSCCGGCGSSKAGE